MNTSASTKIRIPSKGDSAIFTNSHTELCIECMKSLKIKVTEEDIKNGNRCNNESCAIAQAIKRTIPDAKVYVGFDSVYIDGSTTGKCYWYITSIRARSFINKFDSRKTVKPTNFIFKPFSALTWRRKLSSYHVWSLKNPGEISPGFPSSQHTCDFYQFSHRTVYRMYDPLSRSKFDWR